MLDESQRAGLETHLAGVLGAKSVRITNVKRFHGGASRETFGIDTEVDGVKLRAGDMVIAPTELYALNPRMNEDPLRFDLDRKNRNHAAFGGGAHTCPGQFLARMEMRVFLEEWFDRIPSFELEPGQTLRHRGGIVGGCEPFTLRWPRSD